MEKQNLINRIKQRGYWKEIPGRTERVEHLIQSAFNFLFPSCNTCNLDTAELNSRFENLQLSFREFYCPVGDEDCNLNDVFETHFFDSFYKIYDVLYDDAKAIMAGDPAAKSIDEVIHIYPGFYAIFMHRVAHVFYQLNQPVLARIISEYAHNLTGIDIHPGASIGRSFSIDHGTGIVIGETTVIGKHVKVFQGVTLGATSVKKSLADTKRHPTIEDHVVIYSGASILGGDTTIGESSVIGGNVFLTKSVQSNSIVYQKNEVKIKPQKKAIEAINCEI